MAEEFDDSDNESLPDITQVFNARSDPKSTEISKGDIVWAKFKNLYWPALVRSVYKKEKKVSVWYTDDPGKTFKLPLNKVCTFYDTEMVRKIEKDVREAGCVEEHEGLTSHAIKYLQRRRSGYVDDPKKFFDQTYPFFLMEEHLRKNPGANVDGIKISPLYIDHRKKNVKKTARELSSSTIESDIEAVSSDEESNDKEVSKDYLSKVYQELSASTEEDENIDNIVDFVKSGKADDYLEKILNQRAPSKYRDAYETDIASNKRNTNALSYTGPINDGKKLWEIVNYLIPLHEKMFQSSRHNPSRMCKKKVQHYASLNRKMGNLNHANYISSVWLPEAIIYAMSVVYTISLDEARQLFEKKSTSDTKAIFLNLLESESANLNSELVKKKLSDFHCDTEMPFKKLCVVYESTDPYYLSDSRQTRQRVPRDDVGRSHLLKYHYPPLWQMIYWMWSAPITKFWVSNIFYIIYLAIFSLAVIWPSCGSKTLDSIICVWTCLIAIGCTYRLVSVRKAFPNTPVFASCLEIIYLITFVIFLYLIRISDIEAFQDPYAGKVLICAGLIYFYYRMIFIYLPISSTLGPLLYQVKIMITVDFVNFMKLVVFVLIANAIVMQAVLYPDYPLIPELVNKSFHKAFISFFMTPVDELTTIDKKCVKWEQKPDTDTMCRVSDYVDGKCSDGIAFWPYVIVLHYILLLKLILMTVLFALFNNTGATIGPESDSIWKFQRYHLIVDFSNSLRLPPPLSIISVILILYDISLWCFKSLPRLLKSKNVVKKDKKESDKKPRHMSSAECTYWMKLASEYYAIENQKKLEETYIKKELDLITQLSEDLRMKENIISKARAQIIQLETNIYFTHIQLETLKYQTKTDTPKGISLHSLSRESPYLRTKIKRFPVPDKYVPWEVLWLYYEPFSYTMPKEDFPKLLQPYVDEDIMLLQKENKELPVYSWNLESVDANGVYRNRKSWIRDAKGHLITYQLDEYGLPRNPMGRTGLQGKGALPRWGPNHGVFVIITRWKKKAEKDESLMEPSNSLEYVETWFMKKKDCSLPGGFAWSESKYQVVQSCFLMEDESELWQTSDDMNKFFEDHAVGLTEPENSEDQPEAFSSKLICCGYMDDQLNTDQAWKEVELWHVHYGILNNLYKSFKANIRWKLLTEDAFIRLPYGQTILFQDVLRPLNAKVENP